MSGEQDLRNVCTQENGVQVSHASSMQTNCPAINLLLPERNLLWMSQAGLPQSVTLDLSSMIERPKLIKCFGFDCWHDYQSNPAVIEILVSVDGQNFITWITLYPELRQGIQLFPIDPIGRKYNFVKLLIKETFGAAKTYINQVILLEEQVQVTTESMSESQQQTDKTQSNYKHAEYEHQFKPQAPPQPSQFQHMTSPDQEPLQKKEAPKKTRPAQPLEEDLNEKILSMDREVVMLKQSSKPVDKNRNYLALDELAQVQQGFPTLTSTEKEVRYLREEIQHWKQKFESLKAVVDRLDQNKPIQSQPPQVVVSPKLPPSKPSEQVEALIDRKVNERVAELEAKFTVQFQLQEQKFKEQQIELVQKIKAITKPEVPRGRSKESRRRSNSIKQAKRVSSSSSDKENYNSNKRANQKRVASLLSQLQEKLSIRAKKVEELNLSSNKKTRKRRISNYSHNSSSSGSSY